MIKPLVLLALFSAGPAFALDVSLSGANETASDGPTATSVRLPVAAYAPETPPAAVEGVVKRRVLRTARGSRTTLQLLVPLREQLATAGFQTVFTCADTACGGFDFRFQLDLIGAPDMFVDLGDYRYLLMRRETGEPHTVSIVTSRSTGAGFVHITTVSTLPAADVATVTETTPDQPDPARTDSAIDTLFAQGFLVLDDVTFASGGATLDTGGIASLDALGRWLAGTPEARIALVGHTDSIGNTAANLALSQRRAAAVRQRLLRDHDLRPEQVEADGVGYLSPVATNATAEGRAQNRRVEAVLLSTN